MGPMPTVGSLLYLRLQCSLQRQQNGLLATADYNPGAAALPLRLSLPPGLARIRIHGSSSTEHSLRVLCLVQAGSVLLYHCLCAPDLPCLGWRRV